MSDSTLDSVLDPAPPSAASATPLAPLVAIVGPTASGKSALAVALARKFGGEVIACDSTQVYRGFDIGTGKPTAEERAGVVHHLIDVLEPDEPFHAGEYRRRALEVLADTSKRRKLPIFTVGTGLYWRALAEGLADAPQRSDALRERLSGIAARRGSSYLHRILQRCDAAAAARIAPQDRQKLVRALEVRLLAGKPITELHRAGRERLQGYAVLKIGLNPPRPELRARIEQRVQSMIERGWRNEVQRLVTDEAARSAKPLEFIGYRELRDQLLQGTPLPETIAAIVQATRQYAKRQITWFRKEPGVHWFAGTGDSPETQAAVCALVKSALGADPPSNRAPGAPAACGEKVGPADPGTL